MPSSAVKIRAQQRCVYSGGSLALATYIYLQHSLHFAVSVHQLRSAVIVKKHSLEYGTLFTFQLFVTILLLFEVMFLSLSCENL